MRERRHLVGEILTYAKPPVDDGVVYIHMASEGDVDGQLRPLECVRAFTARNSSWRAQDGDRLDNRRICRCSNRDG